MKSGWFFSICVYLFINFHVSESASCLFESSMKDCSSCVMYGCEFGDSKYGCPEDFFKECAAHTNIVNFMKRHNYNDLEYVQDTGVTYISSGSSGDLGMKYANARLKITTSSADYCVEAGKPCTENPTDQPPITSKPATSKPATSKPATSKPATSKPATAKPATSKPPSKSSTIKPRTQPTHVDPPATSPLLASDVSTELIVTASTSAPAPAPTTSSVSNNQNGATKFIGILAFGWIIFSAAWIY